MGAARAQVIELHTGRQRVFGVSILVKVHNAEILVEKEWSANLRRDLGPVEGGRLFAPVNLPLTTPRDLPNRQLGLDLALERLLDGFGLPIHLCADDAAMQLVGREAWARFFIGEKLRSIHPGGASFAKTKEELEAA